VSECIKRKYLKTFDVCLDQTPEEWPDLAHLKIFIHQHTAGDFRQLVQTEFIIGMPVHLVLRPFGKWCYLLRKGF